MYPRRRTRGGHDPWALLMLLQLAQQIGALDDKPAVTVGAIGAMVALHFGVLPAGAAAHCFDPAAILRPGVAPLEWVSRVFLAQARHVDDYHLAYNMGSFLAHSQAVERRYGTAGYAAVLAVLAAGTAACSVALAVAAASLGYPGWLHSCSLGWSGVLFALKAVLTAGADGRTAVFGLGVPTRYAVWAEAAMVALLMPYTSTLVHVGGICAGLAFVAAERAGAVAAVARVARTLLSDLTAAAQGGGGGGGGGGGNDEGGQPQPPRPRFYGGGVPLGRAPGAGGGRGGVAGGGDGLRYRGAAAAGGGRDATARDAALARWLQEQENARTAATGSGR
jgi:membrane associated rhomboid family serine protease